MMTYCEDLSLSNDIRHELLIFKKDYKLSLDKLSAFVFGLASIDIDETQTIYTNIRFDDSTFSVEEGSSQWEAIDVLGDVWDVYLEARASIIRKKYSIHENMIQREKFRREKLICDKCGDKISRQGMEEHQSSNRCISKRIK